jgi:signal transduction histidine kinase
MPAAGFSRLLIMGYKSLLTVEARRHLRLLTRALRPAARALERSFRERLGRYPYDACQCRALSAITPMAASRLPNVERFLGQVEHNGLRLAKMNMPPDEISHLLAEFGADISQALEGRHAPVREQLHLLTVLALKQAYLKNREAKAQAFFGLYRAEVESSGLEDLLEHLVRILTRTFGAKTGRLMLLDGPPTGKLARPLYIRGGRAGEALIACPEMRGAYPSYWSFPVRDSALIQLAFTEEHPWLPREVALLRAFSERCYEAIQRARIAHEVRRLAVAARTAEEEERRRIARELHDESAQSLLLLRLQLEMMQRDAPEPLNLRIAQTRTIAERTIEDIRRTIAALSPSYLERLGLQCALRHLVGRHRTLNPVRVRLQIPDSCGEITLRAQEVIYRVAQEALHNILKHSQATRVKLLLDSTDKGIRLSVRDNGVGFSAQAALAKPMSFGLAGMRERATLLGGTLEVRSAPGRGATVILTLPHALPDREMKDVEDTNTPDRRSHTFPPGHPHAALRRTGLRSCGRSR